MVSSLRLLAASRKAELNGSTFPLTAVAVVCGLRKSHPLMAEENWTYCNGTNTLDLLSERGRSQINKLPVVPPR